MAEGRYVLPDLPEQYLRIRLIDDIEAQCEELSRPLPASDSPIFDLSRIFNPVQLTSGEDVKEVYSMELPSNGRLFEPGDTIGIIPCNTEEDLTKLFRHMNVGSYAYKKCMVVQYREKDRMVKPFLLNKVVTLHDLFKNYIHIRCIPNKRLIRFMAEHTEDNEERTLLEELCIKGSTKYETKILGGNVTFLDLLTSFPSCLPPVSRLLENLPLIIPRPYAIGSSPLVSPDKFRIVFSVERLEDNGEKEGLCTGMLKSIIQRQIAGHGEDLQLKMYFRKPHGFRIINNHMRPLILVASGTGISPFLGFLEHRKMQPAKGITWLLYGCRYKSRDFLFREELSDFIKDGTLTKLITSYSREPVEDIKYVQDNIRKYGKDICDLIFGMNAVVYVCGESWSMGHDVKFAFADIIHKHRGLSLKEAKNFIRNLQDAKRYVNEIWAWENFELSVHYGTF